MRYLLAMVILGFATLFLVGCGSDGLEGRLPDPLDTTPEPGYGAIVGEISDPAEIFGEQEVTVYAAEYVGDDDGNGVYLLEPEIFPQTQMHPSGAFSINSIQPGRYVLVAGVQPEQARLLAADDGIKVFQVEADEVNNVGTLRGSP